MKPTDKDIQRLQHMLDASREIVSFVSGMTEANFQSDRKTSLATVALLLTIGEAASRVSNERRDASSQIDWRGIVGARHRIIHGYDTVDYGIVWGLVSVHVPKLIADLESMLAAAEGSNSP